MTALERPQLLGRLAAAVRAHPMVFVQAPPGYGKSTAIAETIERLDYPVVRYDAAPWDTDGFVEPLVTAVRTVRPDFGRRALALADAGADPRRIGSAFAADLKHVADVLLIVIEDVHLLGETFGAFMDGLFRDPPPAVAWLLSSRIAPQFSVAELLLRDLARVFSSEDLRFDREAIVALARRMAPELGPERIEELVVRTEGWPAGVILSLRTGSVPVATADGSFEAASAFLVEQLLRTFHAEELATLERLAVYDVIDDRVIDAAAGGDARNVLNRLDLRGAMIARLPDGALRVHPMLRDVVVQRIVRRDGAHAVRALHANAARHYAASDRLPAALFHLEAAVDAQATHDLLLLHGRTAIERGYGAQVTRLTAHLDSSAVGDPALRAYLAGWHAKQHGEDRARDRFGDAAAAAQLTGNAELAFAARIEVIEHDLARGRSVPATAIDELRRSAETLGLEARAIAEIRAGWHAAIDGRFADALASANDSAVARLPQQRHATAPLRAYALTVLGRFAEAEAELVGLIEGLQDADRLGLRAKTLIWSARLALLRGETSSAYADALEGRRTGSALVSPAEAAAMHIALAEAATHIGDVAIAEEAVKAGRATASAAWYELDRARFPALASLYGARSVFLRHGARAALAVLEASANEPAPDVQRAMLAADAAWYARLSDAAFADRVARAGTLIASAVPRDAADAVGLNAATVLLATLIGRAKLAIDPPVPDFAAFAALRAGFGELERRGPRFESALVRALADAPTARPDGPATAAEERLTPREAEILDLLALGLTNKEIAQRLFLGTRTVETHVARILGKLGVTSRSRAIAAHIRRSSDVPTAW